MQMHFRKCELVLKPEQAWFASKTVVFGLLHQHVEVSKVHLTFFEWCWHQYVGERTWDTSWWWMALSLLIYCPHPVLLHVFPSINDAPSPTWPKRKPWVSSCTSLSSVLTPKPCCSYPSIFSYLSASFGQGTDISCLDDCIGFLTGFPPSTQTAARFIILWHKSNLHSKPPITFSLSPFFFVTLAMLHGLLRNCLQAL